MIASLRVVHSEIKDSVGSSDSALPVIDYRFIDQVRSACKDKPSIPASAIAQVRDYHRSKILREHILPKKKKLLEGQNEALFRLPHKKAELKALRKQREKITPKIESLYTANLQEKMPWEIYKIVLCLVFGLASVSLMAWAVVNTRNMAISSFPVFAANPDFAWGVGGVIALLALFLEMVPEFFHLKGGCHKAYHIFLGAFTFVAAVIWVAIFAKSAGLLGHGEGISIDLESLLAPGESFLGLAPDQQDLLLTSSQFCLEFLLPALGLAYVYQLIKAHGRSLPLSRFDENPEFQKLTAAMDAVESDIGELKKRIKAPARFEHQVEHAINQYMLQAEACLLQ